MAINVDACATSSGNGRDDLGTKVDNLARRGKARNIVVAAEQAVHTVDGVAVVQEVAADENVAGRFEEPCRDRRHRVSPLDTNVGRGHDRPMPPSSSVAIDLCLRASSELRRHVKVVMHLMRLDDFATSDSPQVANEDEPNAVNRVSLDMLLEELGLRTRRSNELFTRDVLFTGTDEEPYYRHFLLFRHCPRYLR